jgi:hypothetical protein
MARHASIFGAGAASRGLWSLLLLASLLSGAATAQERSPACVAELAAADRVFVAAMARLLAAGPAPQAEKCAALANQIDAIAVERDIHLRCFSVGEQLDLVLAMLDTSAVDFRQTQSELGCNVAAG